MKKKGNKKVSKVSRRDFIKASATAGMLALLPGKERLFAAGSDELRVGLIGCGFRGTGAVTQALLCSNSPVKLWAVGDLFRDQVDSSIELLSKGGEKDYDRQAFPPLVDKMDVLPERQFVGFDAYKKVIDSGVDIVILATPPHFRPEHLKAAVEAGKHVFMEKPVAVDPPGVRSVLASSELAEKKGLSIVTGTQKHHQAHYLDIIKRIHNGDIGEIVGGQCYFNTGELWIKKRQPGWSDMEWQCRNWLYFTWLSGDHIVEQHVHNIDVINWALQSHPIKAMGIGGRQVRTSSEFGNVFDHFAVEYEYPNGVRVLSMCRQTNGCTFLVAERLVGTKGQTFTDGTNGFIKGQNPFKYDGPSHDPYVQEHADLIASIREGKPLNEGRNVAESTMTAIMGRMSAYTGRTLSWNWAMNASKLDLTPPKYEFGDLPVRPVAVPGKTELV